MIGFVTCFTSLTVVAQTETTTAVSEHSSPAFIADDLFVFLHSGAGKQYRILGSINAGSQVTVIGTAQNDFQQIIDDKDRKGWVESQYLKTTPGLRNVIAELNAQLASKDEETEQTKNSLSSTKQQLAAATKHNKKLKQQLENLTKQLSHNKKKLQTQDDSIKKQWFYNGAIVLIIGLILGLLLPRLAVRRRSGMDSWK